MKSNINSVYAYLQLIQEVSEDEQVKSMSGEAQDLLCDVESLLDTLLIDREKGRLAAIYKVNK